MKQQINSHKVISTLKKNLVLEFLFQLLEKFVEEFFDQNPLSQLGVIAIKNKRAEKITELSGNIRKHIKAVQGYVLHNIVRFIS